MSAQIEAVLCAKGDLNPCLARADHVGVDQYSSHGPQMTMGNFSHLVEAKSFFPGFPRGVFPRKTSHVKGLLLSPAPKKTEHTWRLTAVPVKPAMALSSG